MSSAIQIETIGVSRYAPAGANSINLYQVNGQEGLTLAQLIMSVCIKRATQDELMAVSSMNRMNGSAAKLKAAALVLEQIMADGSSWDDKIDIAAAKYTPTQVAADATIKEFVTKELGIDEKTLLSPLTDEKSSYDNRLAAADTITAVMDKLNREVETESVRLQTILGRRDVEYRMSASMVRSITDCGMNTANAMMR